MDYLIKILKNFKDKSNYNDKLLPYLYITLLSLNGKGYNDKISDNELSIISDFLRKINNLKVKIQLKRKEKEIDELLNNIKEIYEENSFLINKYNKDNMDIIEIISTKEPKELTKVIDTLTKEEKSFNEKKDEYIKLRKDINDNIFNKEYILDKDNLIIKISDNDNIIISYNEFYNIFSYLLNVNNYNSKLLKDKNKESNIILINDIIKTIILKKEITKELLIPICLVNILSINKIDYNMVDTSKFKVENIKISDLYSLAKENNTNNNVIKCNNIMIPNSYLYKKIKEIIIDGTYYYENDRFVLEKINKKTSDFKISINIDDIKNFLIANITNN